MVVRVPSISGGVILFGILAIVLFFGFMKRREELR